MKKIPVPVCLLIMTLLLAIPAASGEAVGENKGWIAVYCNENGASVYFDNDYKGVTSAGVLTVEVYTTATPYREYRVEKPGFNTATGSLTMPGNGQTEKIWVTLNPIPTPPQYGSLYVTTSPEGAAVYLNGNYRGVSPLTISPLSAGAYNVRADLSRYQSESDTVTVYAGQQQTERFTLQRIVSPGSITVVSSPSGAYVYIDGNYRGLTPVTLTDVAPGSHSIELDLSGYSDWKSTVRVNNGQSLTVSATLSPVASKTGWILASSSPTGANVFVDSVLKGKTPAVGDLTVSGVPAGNHDVRFELAGYQSYSTTVNVGGDSYSQVSASLTPVNPPPSSTGTLSISSTPSGAEIYTDNIFRGYAPLTLTDVAAGTHTVMAKMAGYQDASVIVSVSKGATVPVVVSLSPVPKQTRAGILPVTVPGALLIALGVFALRKRL
jgi:hypothetical protein